MSSILSLYVHSVIVCTLCTVHITHVMCTVHISANLSVQYAPFRTDKHVRHESDHMVRKLSAGKFVFILFLHLKATPGHL